MSKFTGNDDEEYELTLKIMAEFDELKKRLGDKANIETILSNYPENQRPLLRENIEVYKKTVKENTAEKKQADFKKLQLLMYGTLGQQAQAQTTALDNLKNFLDITALTQSTIPLNEIRNMNRNQQLNLGKQYGLKLENIQATRAWLEWLAKAAGM